MDLAHTGEAADVSPGIGRAVYRVVQESLTNAARHATGARVRVDLRWRAAELQVRVRNAPPAGPARRGSGFAQGGAGLTGLGERVTSIGGQLVAGPDADGGFTVLAGFPLACDHRTEQGISPGRADAPAAR